MKSHDICGKEHEKERGINPRRKAEASIAEQLYFEDCTIQIPRECKTEHFSNSSWKTCAAFSLIQNSHLKVSLYDCQSCAINNSSSLSPRSLISISKE